MDDLSVQELVKKPIHHIPTRFLVDHEPAIAKNSFPEIPIIDLKSLLAEESKTLQIEKLHSTCKEWGIFQLVNHGVDTSLVDKLKYEIEEFYKLPLEDKLKYKIMAGDFEGYGQTKINSATGKIDWADRFYMITNPIHRRKPHLFPQLPSSLRESLEAYIGELQKLSRVIFELIAESLKINKREIAEEMFENGMQSMRLNYYPPCPEPDKVIGVTPHSDASGITILLQLNGVEGLQVKKDGMWIPLKSIPDAFVVNLGDIIEIMSNGLYKSIEHRATVNSEKERISIAMFFNPKFEAQVEPFPSLIVNQKPIFRRMKMEQFVKDFFSRKLDRKSFIEHMKI